MPRLTFLSALLFYILCGTLSHAADPIIRSPRLPETTPWNLKELSQPPAFEWVAKDEPVRSLFYAGEPYRDKPTRVFAYYATPGTLQGNPALDEKLPAMVLIHGGGGTAFREWAELWAKRGYAAIAMDLAGARPIEGKNPHAQDSRTRLDDGGPNQTDDEKFFSIDQPPTEQWSYHAVAAAIRAHSLIRSFPEVDAQRTGVTGISWGGYLTSIVAGLDDRFQAAVPVYGCGFLHDNSAWLGQFAKFNPEQKARWIELWDPSRYLPGVSMPILFVNGTNDFAYPLDSYMKSYDAVPGRKQLCVTVNMPHGHVQGWAPAEIGLFVDQHVKQTPALPLVGNPILADGKVRLTCRSPLKLTKAALHYTTDTTDINKREWKTEPGVFEAGEAIISAPPENATAWFITVTDERGAVISSRTMISK